MLFFGEIHNLPEKIKTYLNLSGNVNLALSIRELNLIEEFQCKLFLSLFVFLVFDCKFDGGKSSSGKIVERLGIFRVGRLNNGFLNKTVFTFDR